MPAGVRVGVKDVAVLSRVFFPKTAEEFVRTIPAWGEPSVRGKLGDL